MLTTLRGLAVPAALSLSIRNRSDQPLDGRMYLDSGPSKRGWHRLQTWIRCHHLFALNQRLHLRFRGKKAAGLGTLMHVGCAHRYARIGAKQPAKGPFLRGVEVDPVFVQERPALVAAGKATITQDQFGLHAWVFDPDVFLTPDEAMQWAWEHDPRLIDRKADGLLDVARTIFKAYESYWASREKMRILAVEVMLETSITSPITGVTRPYTQRLDLAWADTHDSVYIDDHKTAAEPNLDTYNLEGQMAGLRNFGLMRWGNRFRGVNINWIKTEEPYRFYREPPRLSHEATRDFPTLIADAEDEIEWYEKNHPGGDDKLGFWKWRRSMTEHACKTRYGKCDAYELCMGRGQRPEYGGLVDGL